jgi:hypothetical protein
MKIGFFPFSIIAIGEVRSVLGSPKSFTGDTNSRKLSFCTLIFTHMQITSLNYLMPVVVTWVKEEPPEVVFVDIEQDRVFACNGTQITDDRAAAIKAMFENTREDMPIEVPAEILLEMNRERTSLVGGVQDVRTY